MTSESERQKVLDDLDLSALRDFDSEDLEDFGEEDDRNSYVSAMWDKWGFRDPRESDSRDRAQAMAEALLVAHEMCQSFVDTFSNDQYRYRVTFDPRVGVAGTDLVGKVVGLSPSPIYDETITPQQAGVILTGTSAHEVSHVRYGRATAVAVARVFGKKRAPAALSNLLDDVRIEARFAAEYPGYRDVFEPVRRYVFDRPNMRSQLPTFSNMVNLAIRAVKAPDFTTWPTPELEAERDWWREWAARWAKEDAPRRHVEGVREALKRIVARQEAEKVDRQRKRTEEDKRLPEDLLRLRDGLAGLPPLAQKAMRLAGEGKKGPEIAEALGLSVDDARVLVRSARRQLAGDLGVRRARRVTVRTAEDLDRVLSERGLS